MKMGVTESECTLQRKQALSYDAILKFNELNIDRTGHGIARNTQDTKPGNVGNFVECTIPCSRRIKNIL